MPLLKLPRPRTLAAASLAVAVAALILPFATHRPARVLAAKRPAAHTDFTPHPGANPVIVELFTSEGCSSCPPADALLAKLQQDQPVPSANIITLEEHVDYWDHLGWKDRFSSPTITRRQQSYQAAFHLDDIYTPQFVVNGSAQFDGTNLAAISNTIAKAATSTVPLQISSIHVQETRNLVTVTFRLVGISATQTAKRANIYAAIIDAQDSTRVTRGENADRELHHVDVVRAMSLAGWAGQDQDQRQFSVELPAGLTFVSPRLVAFAQAGYGPILAAAVHPLNGINPCAGSASQFLIPGRCNPRRRD